QSTQRARESDLDPGVAVAVAGIVVDERPRGPLIAPDTHAGVGIAEVVADDVAGSGAGDDAGLGVVVALAARDGVVGRVYPVREYLHPVAWVTVGFTLADQVVVALDIPTVVKGCSAVVVSGAVQELATV